jgi:hypothetical protein
MVSVDVQITFGLNRKVETTVASQLLKHVVVERNTSTDICDTSAVQVDGDFDGGLFGAARNLGCTCHVSILAPEKPDLAVILQIRCQLSDG